MHLKNINVISNLQLTLHEWNKLHLLEDDNLGKEKDFEQKLGDKIHQLSEERRRVWQKKSLRFNKKMNLSCQAKEYNEHISIFWEKESELTRLTYL